MLSSAGLALVLVIALALAACGGGGTSETASPTPTASETGPAVDYAALKAEATTPFPEQYSGPTEPAKAPSGIKIACIPCFNILEGCVTPSKGVAEAAAAIGWKETTYDGGGTPTQQNAQMLNAIADGNDVIVLLAVDPKAVQTGMKAAQKAGVMVVSGSSGLSEPNPLKDFNTPPEGMLWPEFDIGPDYAALGEKGAKWIVGDSQGKANVAYFSDKEFPSVLAVEPGLEKVWNEYGITYSDRQFFTGTQVNSVLPGLVVSYLRTHPEADYVFLPYDPSALTVVPAIKNAGFGDRVQLQAVLGNAANQQFIAAGNVQTSTCAYDNIYMGYAIVDQTIRLLNKQELSHPIGENLPFVVLDKTNLPADMKTWTTPLFDYKAEFLKLWK